MLKKLKREKTDLEKVIAKLTAELLEIPTGTDEHKELVAQLEALYKMKAVDGPKPIDPNTVLNVAGSVVGILMILGHERAHVVTSKALSFVLKLR